MKSDKLFASDIQFTGDRAYCGLVGQHSTALYHFWFSGSKPCLSQPYFARQSFPRTVSDSLVPTDENSYWRIWTPAGPPGIHILKLQNFLDANKNISEKGKVPIYHLWVHPPSVTQLDEPKSPVSSTSNHRN